MSKIGFIGTGVMGKSIIRNMMKNNLSVNVYNRTKSKTDDLVAEGAVWYDTPKQLRKRVISFLQWLAFLQMLKACILMKQGFFKQILQVK